MASPYADQVAKLQAEHERLFDDIERHHGGIDYQGRLPALLQEIERAKANQAKFDIMRKAVESDDPQETASAIVEVLLNTDETEAVEEIAADFIENEVGRFDWANNWKVIKSREDPVAKVRAYLLLYDIHGNPQEIVNIIDQMAQETPGRWK